MMWKLFGAFVAVAFMVGTASAAELTGVVRNVNTTANTMDVAGMTFSVGQGTVGASLADLEDGDVVRVRFSPQAGRSQNQRNAIIVQKITDADE